MAAPTKTEVQKVYDSRMEDIFESLEIFKNKLADHEIKFSQDSKNWGFAGDLDRFKELLDRLNN